MPNVLERFTPHAGKTASFYSLPALEKSGIGKVSRLPVSLRIVLESVLRNVDGKRIRDQDVEALARWNKSGERTEEIPFLVSRVLLQDFTGVPLLVDLAAMRSAAARANRDAKVIEPLCPVELVIDHSVQVDYAGWPEAFRLNMEMEFTRNRERYEFLKWGTQAFETFKIIPPGFGICHQVNLEYLARGVLAKKTPGGEVYYPDSLVGTDSHTTMVNGLGIVGWGAGGIEAEAAMLGQPVYFLTPDVVGVHMHGKLPEGATATDLVLHVTELLRKTKVVGKFVEFHGEGAASLAATDRATVANMAPEYGATMGYFPIDDETCKYLAATGRTVEHVESVRRYFEAQGMFGIPKSGQCDYSTLVEFDLAHVEPSVAGPKRPQDRIALAAVKKTFHDLLGKRDATGYDKSGDELSKQARVRLHANPAGGGPRFGGGDQTAPSGERNVVEMANNRPTPDAAASTAPTPPSRHNAQVDVTLGHGSVVIAAITSCTNTSNPSVMLGAGLLAKKAVAAGLETRPWVKASLGPGSRAVTEYLDRTGLQPFLDRLGFNLVGYGCTTCIGNSGPLDKTIEDAVVEQDLVAAAVLSGNRNFEARVHQSVKANFLMSPPLVVAFALAGRIDIDFAKEPLGDGKNGPVYLRDIWPTLGEVAALMGSAFDPAAYRALYADVTQDNPLWDAIPVGKGEVYGWSPESTYIREPPYFLPEMAATGVADVLGARPLAIFGDSITTDHISPAGSIKPTSPAGKYLTAHGVATSDFNSYGARRGSHEVMVRGTFANVRIKNLMVKDDKGQPVEGGWTLHQPDRTKMAIYDAALKYEAEKTPLIVIAGQEYGTGSSRDWAAKGTRLLGVRVVVARSFERIHRSNLVGMGVLPVQFLDGDSAQSLGLDGSETYDLKGVAAGLEPRMQATLVVHRKDGRTDEVKVVVRIDTPIEVEYYKQGGILPYVFGQLSRGQEKGARG